MSIFQEPNPIAAVVKDLGGVYVAEAPWMIHRPEGRGGGKEPYLFVATSALDMKEGLLRHGLVPAWGASVRPGHPAWEDLWGRGQK